MDVRACVGVQVGLVCIRVCACACIVLSCSRASMYMDPFPAILAAVYRRVMPTGGGGHAGLACGAASLAVVRWSPC